MSTTPSPSRLSQWNTRRRTRSIGLYALAVFATLLAVYRWQRTFPDYADTQYDDSYITYRYAANLVSGDGLRFNPEGQENSSSSLLYTLLLALAKIVTPFNFPTIGLIIGVLGLIAATVLIFAIATEIKTSPPVLTFAALAAITFAANGVVGFWAVSGMDTLFFIAVLLASLWTCLRALAQNSNRKSVFMFTMCLVALVLTRPEGIAVALVLIAYTAAFSLFASWCPLSRHAIVLIGTVTVAAIISLFTFYFLYYGNLIPDPVRFKRLSDYYSLSTSEQGTQIRKFLSSRLGLANQVVYFTALAVSILLILNSKIEPRVRALASLILGVAAVITLLLMVSAYSDEYRYFVPVISIACLLIGLIGYLPFGLQGASRRSAQSLLIIFTVSAALLLWGSQRIALMILLDNSRFLYLQQARVDMGKWLEEDTARDSKVLAGDLGALSFYNLSNYYVGAAGLVNRPILDSLENGGGYKRPIVAALPQFVVDTEYAAEGLASEIIFNSPSSYYDGLTVSGEPRCSFRCNYSLSHLQSFPSSEEPITPRIAAYSLTQRNDKS